MVTDYAALHRSRDDDSIGPINMNGRWYNPDLGRMIQADPDIQARKFLELQPLQLRAEQPAHVHRPERFFELVEHALEDFLARVAADGGIAHQVCLNELPNGGAHPEGYLQNMVDSSIQNEDADCGPWVECVCGYVAQRFLSQRSIM